MNDEFIIENEITKELDEILERAKNSKSNDLAQGFILRHLPGSGATSIVKSWLENNNLKNLYISSSSLKVSNIECEYLPANELANTTELTARIVGSDELTNLLTPKKTNVNVIFSSETIDSIDENTVVVLDDYDFASQEVRDELFNYILYHKLVDIRMETKDNVDYVKPLMLVIIIDTANLSAKHPLTLKELKLFGMDEKYAK